MGKVDIRRRGWWGVLLIIFCLGAAGAWLAWQAGRPGGVGVLTSAARTAPVTDAPAFSPAQLETFFKAARQAEAIDDPLRRCLAYPDPPASHWSPDAVRAYCRYQLQATISADDVRQLIESNQAGQLDKQLAQALHDQLTNPDSRGLLDRIYIDDFGGGSLETREMVDAWLRQSPDSAFALAASGLVDVSMAYQARGGKFAQDTPQDNFDAMGRLVSQGVTDLRRALSIEPHLAPAYAAWVSAASGIGSRKNFVAVSRFALTQAPDDYWVYSNVLGSLDPKWQGSLKAMQQFAHGAQARASANPLLKLLLSDEPAVAAALADAAADADPPTHVVRFDQVADVGRLRRNGIVAQVSRQFPLAAVYLSEAMRFDPQRVNNRERRIKVLMQIEQAPWALQETNRLLSAKPGDEMALSLRAEAYQAMKDYAHAQRDYLQLAQMQPGDKAYLINLGYMQLHARHWDDAWAAAQRMERVFPEEPYGWLLQAEVQMRQPRAGLQNTVNYVHAHFGDKPRVEFALAKFRAALVAQKKAGAVPHAP